MKAKTIIIIAGLGIAFGAVSLWVIITRNRNAKAVAAKFRLGGMIIAATSLLSSASCGCKIIQPDCYDPEPTCYDMPAEVNITEVTSSNGSVLTASDAVFVNIDRVITESEYYYEIWSDREEGSELLKKGPINVEPDTYSVSQPVEIKGINYKGAIKVQVYATVPEVETPELLNTEYFTIE